MSIEQELFISAKELIESRYPIGFGGAASVRLKDGRILTSVAPEVKNDALSLCMEVGALLEANKLNIAVSHSLCMYRETELDDFILLSPCGICQERLIYWGPDVKVAISNPDNLVKFVPLKQLMPHHWSQVNDNGF